MCVYIFKVYIYYTYLRKFLSFSWFCQAFLFPERRFVAGFFRRLLAYLTPCISISIIPHISIQDVSCQYVSFPYVSIQYVSIQYVSHQYVSIQCVSMQCLSKVCTYPVNTYPTNTYPSNTYPINTYPFNAYPFKRYASAGMAMYVNAKQILAYCIPLHQQEWQSVWVSLHVISYHCYLAGMAMKIKTLPFLQFLCNFINWI